MFKRAPYLVLLLLPLAAAFALTLEYGLGARYQPGYEARFEVVKNGQVNGEQVGRCTGWTVEGADSLLHFEMNSTVRLQQSGQPIDLQIDCQVDYYPDGRPLNYNYNIDALGRKVKHRGAFSSFGYSGNTDRFGVEFPISQSSKRWPLLLDSHFGLQWEIASVAFRMPEGDSALYGAMIPQTDTLVLINVKSLPREKMLYGGDSVVVRPYRVDPVNQIFYLDSDGRLLKAYDPAQRTLVRRLAAGEESNLPTQPFFSTLYKRLPGYLLILVFALLWYVVLSRREVLRPRAIFMLLLGAVIGWPVLVYLMPELAIQYERLLASPNTPSLGTYLTVAGLAVMFAVVGEGVKLLLIWWRLRLTKKMQFATAVALGAAFGAGFAFVQAAYLTNFMPSGSLMQPADLWQRFFLIGIDALNGGMLALFLFRQRAFWYFLIPFGIKAIATWLFVFVQQGSIKMPMYYFLLGIICLFTALLFVGLYLKSAQRRPQTARKRRR